MTKALDAAGASAPEAGELARRLRMYTKGVYPGVEALREQAADEIERLQKVCALHWETIGYANKRAEKAEAKLAETEKRLAEADAALKDCEMPYVVSVDGIAAREQWVIARLHAKERHALRSAATSGKGE
jgi:hypothetical protein